MLRQLAIRNVVLVEELELEFDAGLGVLTGETGAGKVDPARRARTGAWARGRMRGWSAAGEEAATVSAEIELRAGHPVHALLARAGHRGGRW